jgi:hypothetical protein
MALLVYPSTVRTLRTITFLVVFLCTSTRRMAGLFLCGLMPTFFFLEYSLHSVLHDLLLLDIIFPLQTQKRYTVEKITLIHEMSIRYHTKYSNDTPQTYVHPRAHTLTIVMALSAAGYCWLAVPG